MKSAARSRGKTSRSAAFGHTPVTGVPGQIPSELPHPVRGQFSGARANTGSLKQRPICLTA